LIQGERFSGRGGQGEAEFHYPGVAFEFRGVDFVAVGFSLGFAVEFVFPGKSDMGVEGGAEGEGVGCAEFEALGIDGGEIDRVTGGEMDGVAVFVCPQVIAVDVGFVRSLARDSLYPGMRRCRSLYS
jgi:hypothetical protein